MSDTTNTFPSMESDTKDSYSKLKEKLKHPLEKCPKCRNHECTCKK